jgi:hypothetical protein
MHPKRNVGGTGNYSAGSHGAKEPAMAAVHAGKDEIPMEDDFKEF